MSEVSTEVALRLSGLRLLTSRRCGVDTGSISNSCAVMRKKKYKQRPAEVNGSETHAEVTSYVKEKANTN